MDSIVALEAVLPEGTISTITPDSSPDLWFALRGAADSFAITTNFYLQTHPVPLSLVFFSYSFPSAFPSANTTLLTSMFLHLQSFASNASAIDNRITFDTYIDGATFSTTSLFHGTLPEFNSRIALELLRGMPLATANMRAVDWTESLALLAGSAPLSEPTGAGYTLHDTFYAKSLTVPTPSSPSSLPLIPAALAAFFT